MLIVVMIAFVGGLCLTAGVTGLAERSAEPLEAGLNMGTGLVTLAGVAFLFLRRRR